MPTKAAMEAAFKVHTDEMARCRAQGCNWALFHLVIVMPDIAGALTARNGEASTDHYRTRRLLPGER